MTKLDLALRLAQESGRSPAEAADDLDELVQRLLKTLRKGRPTASEKPQAAASKGPERRPAKTAKPERT